HQQPRKQRLVAEPESHTLDRARRSRPRRERRVARPSPVPGCSSHLGDDCSSALLVPTSKDLVFRKTLPERLSLTQNSEPAKKSSDYSEASCISNWSISRRPGALPLPGSDLRFVSSRAHGFSNRESSSVLI